jgi:hypothetical protein
VPEVSSGGPQRSLTLLLSYKVAALRDESKEHQGLRNYCQAFLRLLEPGRKQPGNRLEVKKLANTLAIVSAEHYTLSLGG